MAPEGQCSRGSMSAKAHIWTTSHSTNALPISAPVVVLPLGTSAVPIPQPRERVAFPRRKPCRVRAPHVVVEGRVTAPTACEHQAVHAIHRRGPVQWELESVEKGNEELLWTLSVPVTHLA